MRFIAVIFIAGLLAGCNESVSVNQRSKAERVAEESSEKNPIKKGRYECWKETESGKQAAVPFYVLSNNMYQFDEYTGKYTFDVTENRITFIDGPLAEDGSAWTGQYLQMKAGSQDAGEEPMIWLRAKDNTVLRCTCSIFMY